MITLSELPVASVFNRLFLCANNPNFWDVFSTAFGGNYDVAKATSLRHQWVQGDFSNFPAIEVVGAEVLGTAKGAYAIATNKIYLSEGFLATASEEVVVAVLLEEYGHFVDAQINSTDTVGDEGAIFAALVLGKPLSEEALAYMKAEDDAGVVIIDGKTITVEQQVTRTWNAPINGFWDVSSNWTGNQLPVAGDDVIISFSSNNITTTYRTGNNSLNSVLSDEAFVINGGTLTVGNLTVNDNLTLSSGNLALNGTTASKLLRI